VVLDLAPSARWVAEQYPNEGVELRADGRLRVRLRTGQRAWLERLLLRAGTDTVVVEGDAAVRTGAAERILARYRS
jgi:proteasome accessory factor C